MIGCVLQGEISLSYSILQRDGLQTPANASNLTASDLLELPSFCMHLESALSSDLIYRHKPREGDVEILHFAPNLNSR